ncbi:hypothetical protein NC651_017301 [Populus alba x Populus x berolinensis]|nr:hypothetical protein NC651_017301 [Populus alba x Populus x berolinensis]
MSLLILKEQQRNGKEAICQILLNRFKILEAVVKLHQRVRNQNHPIVKLAWTHFPRSHPMFSRFFNLEPQYCESKELDEFIIQGPIHLETNTNPEQQHLNLPAVAKGLKQWQQYALSRAQVTGRVLQENRYSRGRPGKAPASKGILLI